MRRPWLMTALICFLCSGMFMAFSNEQAGMKEEYQKRTEASLKRMKQKAVEMKVNAASLRDQVKEDFGREMKEFEKKQEMAQRKLKKLRTQSADAWGSVKMEVDTAMEELKKEYDRLQSTLKK